MSILRAYFLNSFHPLMNVPNAAKDAMRIMFCSTGPMMSPKAMINKEVALKMVFNRLK